MKTVSGRRQRNKVSDGLAVAHHPLPELPRRRRPSESPRLKKGSRVFWSGEKFLEGEQLIVTVSDGSRRFNYSYSKEPPPGPQSWCIKVIHHFEASDRPNRTRSVRLTLNAFPVVSAVIAETVTPEILADWIEDHPSAVLTVTNKRSKWRQTQYRCGRGFGVPVEEEVTESDEEAIAELLKSLRIGWPGSFLD